jgi:hypothetical protein
MASRGLLLVVVVLAAASASAWSRTLLVGTTGVGKTHLCNMYSRKTGQSTSLSACGKECNGFQSCTSTMHLQEGLEMIDTPGFGDNRGGGVVTDVNILVDLIRSVNSTRLRAIMWVMSCYSRPSQGEISNVHTLHLMLDKVVPLVPVFGCTARELTRFDPRRCLEDLVANFDVDLDLRDAPLFQDTVVALYNIKARPVRTVWAGPISASDLQKTRGSRDSRIAEEFRKHMTQSSTAWHARKKTRSPRRCSEKTRSPRKRPTPVREQL